MADKKAFQDKLRSAAGRMQADGVDPKEIQAFIDRKKDEYRSKYEAGKTQELEKEDATAVQNSGASDSEDTSSGLSKSDQEIDKLQRKAQMDALFAGTPYQGAPDWMKDKVLALSSGTSSFISNIAKVPSQLTYAAIQTGLGLFDPDSVDTPEERKMLKMVIENASPQASGLTQASKKLDEFADDTQGATTQHDKSIGQQFAAGEIGSAIDQTMQQVMFSAPSVAAAFTGTGGLAMIGASSFGGKFEEEFEKNPMESAAKLTLVAGAAAGIEVVSESFTAGIAGRAKALLGKGGKAAAEKYLKGTVTTLFKEAGIEGSSEAVATFANKYLDALSFNRDVNGAELFREMVDAFIVGGVTGGGIASVGIAGADTSKALVNEKVKPDEVKEASNDKAQEINRLEKAKKENPKSANLVDEIIDKKKDEIDDIEIEHSEVVDNITDEDKLTTIINNNRINEINEILADESVDDQSREILEAEALELKEANGVVYETAKSENVNITQSIEQLDLFNKEDTSELTEDEKNERAITHKKVETGLEDKLVEESLPDTPVSPSTRKEIERGNVRLELNENGEFVYIPANIKGYQGALRPGESARGPATPFIQETIGTIYEVEEQIKRIQEQQKLPVTYREVDGGYQLEAADPKTGLPIVIQPVLETNWERAISETSGYPVVKGARALVQKVGDSVQPSSASATEAAVPGLTQALDNYNKLQKVLKGAAALRTKSGEVSGNIPQISDQHRAFTGLIQPLKNVAGLNDTLAKLQEQLKNEKNAKPTVNEQGQATGGPDPAKIADLENQIDQTTDDLLEAVSEIPTDFEAPVLYDSEAFDRRAASLKGQKRAAAINKLLSNKNITEKSKSKLRRELEGLTEGKINSLARYNADLKGKKVAKLSKKDVKDYKSGKISAADLALKANGIVQAASYNAYGATSLDAIQHSNLAVIEALSDPKIKKKITNEGELVGEIYNAVRHSMIDLRNNLKTAPVTGDAKRLANKTRKASEALLGQLERQPTTQEISNALENGIRYFERGQYRTIKAAKGENVSPEKIQEVLTAEFVNRTLADNTIIATSDGEIDILNEVQGVIRTANQNKSLSGAFLTTKEIQAIDDLVAAGKLSVKDAVATALKGRNLSEFADKIDAIIADPAKAESLIDAVESPSASKEYKKAKRGIQGILEIEALERFQSGFKDKGYIVPARYIPPGLGKDVNLNIEERPSNDDLIEEIRSKIDYSEIDSDYSIDDYLEQYTSDLDVLDNYFDSTDDISDADWDYIQDGIRKIPVDSKINSHNDLSKAPGKIAKLNIGLENNPIDNIDGIIKKLEENPKVTLGTTQQVDGEYLGEVERTVVVNAKFDGTPAEFKSYIESLSAELTQEAIGTEFDGTGDLVYDPKFKGDRYTFDPQFFLQPGNVELSIEDGNKQYSRSVSTGDAFIQQISSLLQKNWPHINLIMSNKRWNNFTSQLAIPIPPTVRGLQAGDTVALNPNRVGLDTPIHEFSHIWLRGLQQTNPKLWLRGKELLEGTEYVRIIYDNPMYRQYLRDGEKARFWEEVMANAVGKRGSELFNNQKDVSKWDQFIDTLNKWVKQKLGISSKKDYKDLTLEDWLDQAVLGTVTNSYEHTSQPTNANPAFNIEETVDRNVKISNIQKLLNDPQIYKTDSKYKQTKIDSETQALLNNTKKALATKQDQLTDDQLSDLYASIQNAIAEGRKKIQGQRKDIAGKRSDIRSEAASIIQGVAGIDPTTLNTNDIDVLAKENVTFLKRLKTRGIGGVIADALAPSSNDDYYGLLARLIPRTGDRAKVEKVLADTLIDPLQTANNNYIKSKQGMLAGLELAKKSLGPNADKILGQTSNIKVGRNTLTNSQVAMVYNYIKDPRLHKQLIKGGINPEKMTEILDYMDNNTDIKGFANQVPKVFSDFKYKLNNKLAEHGYRDVKEPAIATDLDPETKAILERVYDGNIPETAPYTPFFGEGADNLELTEESFGEGDKNFYTVMSGRLKQRTYGGNVDFKGKDVQSMFDTYVNGPVRTEAFLDFAKNSSAFFASDNLKAAKASLGESWGKSMEDSMRRIITGSNNRSNNPESVTALDKWLTRTIGNIMFFNPRSAILQQVSMLNFAVGDPISYAKAAGDVKASKEAFQIIWNSDFLKDRQAGKTDVVVDELFKQKGDTQFTQAIDRLGQQGYFLTKKSDAFAIAAGGAPWLAAKLKENGGDVDAAMKEFEILANESQQSTSPDRLGRDQTHPTGRYLLAFTNATQQFNRIMAKSAREISAGVNTGKNFRKISYIMGTQIAGFAFLQKAMFNAIDFDDDKDKEKAGDYLSGIMDTLITSAGIMGSVFGTVTQAAKQALRGYEGDGKFKSGTDQKAIQEFLNISPAIATKLRNLKNTLNEPYRQSEGFIKNVDPNVARLASGIQFATGIPTDRVLRILESFNDIGANDLYLLEKVGRVLGWSRYDFDQQLGKDPSGRRGRDLKTRRREERAKQRQR